MGSVQTQDDSQNTKELDEEDEDERSGSYTAFSEGLTDCNQQIPDNMSTTSSDLGHMEINPAKEELLLKQFEADDDVVMSSRVADEETVNSTNEISKQPIVNHIQKNSYQNLFADESAFGKDLQNHIDCADITSLEDNDKNVMSSSVLHSNDVPKSKDGLQECLSARNVMPLKELASLALSENDTSEMLVTSNIDSSSNSKNIALTSLSADINQSLTTEINPPVVKMGSQSRDFPHLPLVGNLFTANFIDDIINGAMDEIKQKHKTSCVQEIEEKDSSDFSKLVEEITRGMDTLTDNLHRQSDVSYSDVSSLGLEDVAMDESVSSDLGEKHTGDYLMSDIAHPISNFEIDQEMSQVSDETFHVNSQQENGSPIENHWSQCNGYLADEEEPYTAPEGVERELLTEIVFISETSFMDEETQQHYDPEDSNSIYGTALNPDAPEFVPFAVHQTSTEPADVPNVAEASEERKMDDNKKSEDSVNRYSDFEDRVDISDSSDEILMSKLYLKRESLASDVIDCTSMTDVQKDVVGTTVVARLCSQEIDKVEDRNQLISSGDSGTNTMPEIDKSLDKILDDQVISLEDVKDEERPSLIIFGGDLFEDIDLDNNDNKISLLDDVFTPDHSKLPETSEIETVACAKSSMDMSGNDDVNFSDDEYISEQYMDHQQIYDPLKYKDYYQICSKIDVPDSPLDILNQDKMLNATKSSTTVGVPKVSTELPSANPPESRAKNKTKVEECENIPGALKARTAEIILHEADNVSDCGSEDIETIGHRYETTDEPNHTFVNELSLAAEMLRTKQELPYDDQFKPVMAAGGSVPTVATLNHGTVLGTPSRANRNVQHHYYGNPCFEMEDMQPERSKEVSDSGVQSEESTDESEDCRRQWNEQQTGDNSPHKASFGYKKLGTKSKPVSAMLKGKTDPLCLCCEIM